MNKILILTANPENTDRIRLDEEVREIQEGLMLFMGLLLVLTVKLLLVVV